MSDNSKVQLFTIGEGNAPRVRFTSDELAEMWQAEIKGRREAERALAEARFKLSRLGGMNASQESKLKRLNALQSRTGDIRRPAAQYMLAALVTAKPDGNPEELVDQAIALADLLLTMLEATRVPRERFPR